MKGVTRLLIATAVIGFLVLPAPLPAHGCSCAGPGDLTEAIAQSEAAFVGTLVDKRSTSGNLFGGGDAIYTFEVEQWIKADLGPVIEVRSASQGSACGFEVDIDERMGAFISRDGNHLSGGLCTTVDPDALLAAASGPVTSPTGIPRLVASFNGDEVFVLDAEGRYITSLESPPELANQWGGGLDACPGGEMLVQHTSTSLLVWDMRSLELVATYTEADGERAWVTDVACRSDDASTIWAIIQTETTSTLQSVVPEGIDLGSVPSSQIEFGATHGIVVDHEFGTVTVLDFEEGTTTDIWSRDPDQLADGSADPHPSDDTTALLETRFYGGEADTDASLIILDARDEPIMEFDIPYESYQPTWIDEERVMVSAYDWTEGERSVGYLFDITTQEVAVFEDWTGFAATAMDLQIISLDNAKITSLDPETGNIELLTALPTQWVEDLVVLAPGLPPVAVDVTDPVEPTSPTTPPLSADDSLEGVSVDWSGPSSPTVQARWILVGLALIAGVGLWRFRARSRG